MFLPLSLVFFVEFTDIRLSMLGVLVGIAGFTSVPVPAVAGRSADRYGARRLSSSRRAFRRSPISAMPSPETR